MSADKSRAERLAEWLDHHGEKRAHADAAAELRRLSASEAALIEALEVARVRCTSKDYDRFAALIAKTKEARNG